MSLRSDIKQAFEDAGLTIATGSETEKERLDRIIAEINAGERTKKETIDTIMGMGVPGPDGRQLNNVAEGAEVWRVGNKSLVVFMVPGTEDDPVYMSWEVSSDEDLEAMFGPDNPIVYTREMSQTQYNRMGVLDFGETDELPATEKNPFAGWEQNLKTQAVSQPWILEEDYQALMAMAILEGRALTQAEIKTTDYWQRTNAAEKQWMALYHGEPKEAERLLEDNKRTVRQMLIDAGAGTEPPQSVIDHIATQWTHGKWSESYARSQVKAITDPYSKVDIDESLAPIVEADPLTQTIDQEDRVRELVHQWLGPMFGSWDQNTIAEWAGRLRNNPEAEQQLVEHLKDQRVAVLPEYEDREISYQAIANTWKQYWIGQWGQNPDEKNDNLWLKVLKANDTEEAGRMLRKEGYNRGVEKVVTDMNALTRRSLGGTVRDVIYA